MLVVWFLRLCLHDDLVFLSALLFVVSSLTFCMMLICTFYQLVVTSRIQHYRKQSWD